MTQDEHSRHGPPFSPHSIRMHVREFISPQGYTTASWHRVHKQPSKDIQSCSKRDWFSPLMYKQNVLAHTTDSNVSSLEENKITLALVWYVYGVHAPEVDL